MNATELLAKYDVPGPRYTSYPTVPYWATAPTQEEWITHLEQAVTRSRAKGEGASLYLHVPFCRSLCHYCGCNTFITREASVIEPYVAGIQKEWALYTARVGRVRLEEVHVGGGTPTHLPAAPLERMLSSVLSGADVPDDAELSIEVDPRVTTRDQLEVLARLGFTRISLGIQDFDPVVQSSVNRHQTVDEVRLVSEAARSLGFDSVNFDLIYGLPKQTPDSIRQTMEAVNSLRPDRIAFYGYAHVPWMKPVMRKFEDSDVPGGPARRALYETGREALAEAGYQEIGLDHFGLEGDGLLRASRAGQLHRNFMGYTERSTMPIFALGVSSIGDTWTAYAQNEKTLPGWHARLEKNELPLAKGHVLTEEDLVLRRLILDVMTRFETLWARGRVPYLDEVPGKLAELQRDGLVQVSGDGVRVTEAGRPFVRNVCMALDARLARQAPDKPIFSRTV
ncbi:MAG: oxygen-independent coproporphyrinogen III oxidase [Myxococcales bacterium]|nr:oxygen-independent coproporphyrinogen III oxidase [Myxococcales bacterium]